MKNIFILLCCIPFARGYAQYAPVVIPGSETRKITSSIVPGQEYELQIMLPAGYATSTKKYPVAYLMDSQWDFPLVKCIYGEQYYDGLIPEMIVVGVTWGGDHPNPDSLRARDYTPTREARLPQSGGADAFLDFMKKELFPFIESNYKVDSTNRTLMGCSLGGLLTLYTLFTHYNMFTGYVAASPAFAWDKEVLYRYEKLFYQNQPRSPARVYLTVGGVERGVPGFEKLAAFLKGRHYSAIQLRSKVLDNTGHSGTKNETYARGLQYVFERPALQLAAEVLNQYTGRYTRNNGDIITIKNEQHQLVAYAGTFKTPLYAASTTNFYGTSEFLNIHFIMKNGKTAGFELFHYGSSEYIKKIN